MHALRFIFGCAILIWASSGSSAFGQNKPSPKFEQYLNDPEYTNLRARALEYQDINLPMPSCSELRFQRRVALQILKTPAFLTNATTPHSGQWIETILADRCGARVVRNFFVNVVRIPEIIPLVPGVTLASASMQVDIQKAVLPIAASKLACNENQIKVTDTALTIKPSGDGPWRENWIFSGCGKGSQIVLDFMSNGKGGYTAAIVTPP